LEGQANYVSCACVLPPNSTYPEGVILTGSNDHSIFAFSPVSGEVLHTLIGHANAGKLSNLIFITSLQTQPVPIIILTLLVQYFNF
jgi:hypothetical protein